MCYEGDFVRSAPHGQGTFRHSNGDEYKGDWVLGYMHGRGTLTCKDGTRCSGQYVLGSKCPSPSAQFTGSVTDLKGDQTSSVPPCPTCTRTGIIHAHSVDIAGYREQAAADVVPVLGFKFCSVFPIHKPEAAFDFVRHGNPKILIPNDGSRIVVAKVQGRTSNGSVLVGALDSNELQAHFAKYESCPHKLNYKWRARPCSYLVRRSLDPTDPVVSLSQFSFLWYVIQLQ